MSTLEEVLTDPDRASGVIEACCKLVETEVQSKRGVSGLAVKAGYTVVCKVKPTIVRDVVSALMPAFARALEPMYQRSGASAQAFRTELEQHPDDAAEALLGVTDRRIERSQPVIQKAYGRLRKAAVGHVRDAIPGVARSITPYI